MPPKSVGNRRKVGFWRCWHDYGHLALLHLATTPRRVYRLGNRGHGIRSRRLQVRILSGRRQIKKAIPYRKNALFHQTCDGANVRDAFVSLIYACELYGANPFDYLTESDRYADDAASNPGRWIPWNYRQALAGTAP
jgi:hypothetical protein